jgi:GTP-binding protein HflX
MVAPQDGQGLAWLHENTEILERETTQEGETRAHVRVTAEKEPYLLSRFPTARHL